MSGCFVSRELYHIYLISCDTAPPCTALNSYGPVRVSQRNRTANFSLDFIVLHCDVRKIQRAIKVAAAAGGRERERKISARSM